MKYCQEELCVTSDLFHFCSITVQIAQKTTVQFNIATTQAQTG